MSTLAFCALITIGNLKIDFVNEVKVRSTWKEMTDTAIIKIARRVLIKGKDENLNAIADVIKIGHRVVIQLGYDGNLQTEFIGYVSRSPKPGIPVEITCEDEMFKLKRTPITNKVFANHKLSDLLAYMLPDYTADDFDIFNTALGANYSLLNEHDGNVALALKKIEDTFDLKSFFRLVEDKTRPEGYRPVLIVGKPYASRDLVNAKPVTYKLRANTRTDSLEYRFKEDNPIQIKGIVKVDNGKDLTAKYPKDQLSGSVVTRHYYNITKEQLEDNIKADWVKTNIDRYEGTISAFGIPFSKHGMVANIIDDFYEPRDNLNFIDIVEVNVTINGGYQRINTIGYVVNDLTRNTFK